jgi:Protein of unknown function (DUF4238)
MHAAMNEPRDHHFMPAFYLKQWEGPSGQIIEYKLIRNAQVGRKLVKKLIGRDATGFERDLYAFPELPPDAAQFIEQQFFAYADQKASDALDNHLGIAAHSWTSELVSAWSRFVIAIHLRHPDAMPELRQAAKQIWDASGVDYQTRYEAIRKPEYPPTFDEYLAQRDPLLPIKMHVNLIIKGFDNDIVGAHINKMPFAVIDLSASRHRLLLSDRPVEIFNLKDASGLVSIPISPTKLFVAANEDAIFAKLRRSESDDLVRHMNAYVVSRARRFVWAQDASQERFITNRMSTKLEPTPLFPNIGRYEPPPPAAEISDLIDTT